MEDQTEILIARGEAAAVLLQSEAFMAASNELVNSHLAQIVQSKLGDTDSREASYRQVKAVQDIIGTLNQWVSVGAQAKQSLEIPEID